MRWFTNPDSFANYYGAFLYTNTEIHNNFFDKKKKSLCP